MDNPVWCEDKNCNSLAHTKECCIGKPLKVNVHDGILNDMSVCSNDDRITSWYVNSRDLRVLFLLVAKALRAKGERLPEWIYRQATIDLPDNKDKVEWK